MLLRAVPSAEALVTEAHSRASVLAVVVATDGEPTLPRTLAGLAAQDHPDLAVVGVDNGSADGSRQLLLDALGPDNVLVADRDLGFGGAVDLALASAAAGDRELVLLVHDDLELRPDAVRRLVAAFDRDPRLAIAGCKLLDWHDPARLQAVGMRVDVTGRADSGVDADEIDQGQHDHVDEVLYVSTAGMMVDRARFDELGRFDVRYHLFRDDLDLCWRAHLAGFGVEVVTDAVAQHAASAATYGRLGQTAYLGPRYFAERNTLASLLKNYGGPRLLAIVPLFLLVGVAKVLGFVATRRLSDAWQTVRAWLWNVVHLRETWRLRRRTQALRSRPDGELSPLFARVVARVRAYAEALGDALAGGSDAIESPVVDPADEEVPTLRDTFVRTLRTSPVGVAATVLAVLGLVVGAQLVGPGTLRGGELAPWPAGVGELLGAYVDPSTIGDLPGVLHPSPSLALLEGVSLAAGGSPWAAPRLLVLLLVPLAWVAALAAGRLVTERRLPRVAGASLYALSPPMLAVLRTGQVRAGVVAVLLPLLLLAAARAFAPGVAADRAWRAAAALAVLTAVLLSFEPLAAVLVVLVALGVLVGALVGPPATRNGMLARLAAGIAGVVALLVWSPPAVLRPTVTSVEGSTALWRSLLLSPDLAGFPPPLVGAGLLAGALLGLVVVDRSRRLTVAVMWTTLLVAVGTAWQLVRLGADAPVWPGTPLLLAALAAAILLGVAFSSAGEVLGAHDFGWRQVASGATTAVVVVGLVGSVAAVATGTWDAYARDGVPQPAFLASDTQVVGPFRVLLLADDGDRVHWQLTDADGPSAATLGAELPAPARQRIDDLVVALLSGADPDAAGRLGPLGVRYVVVPGPGRSPRLDDALTDQLDLTDEPVNEGTVRRVDTWLPRFAVVPASAAPTLEAQGVLPLDVEAVALGEGTIGPDSLVVEADVVPGPLVPRVDGQELRASRVGPLRGWLVPAGAEVSLATADATARRWRLVGQLLVLLLAVSLSLRAPRFARPPVVRR